MTIPVIWLRKRRLCWDQSMVDTLLTNELGHTGYEFEHRLETNLPSSGGAIVVVPARYYDDPTQINVLIEPLDWVLLILTSDEESLFDWAALKHPHLRLWVMTPRPDVHDACDAFFLGEGWPLGTRELLRSTRRAEDARPLLWFFAGQVTHERRQGCFTALMTRTDGEAVATPGFTQGLPQSAYLRQLATAKLAPCPAGPATPDSFRLYEALEAGCLPIVDAMTPEGWRGYWDLLSPETPFPVIEDWATLPEVLDRELADWPANANRAMAWWQQEKHQLVTQLQDDLEDLNAPRDEATLADLLTVVVTTSPIPSHPSTEVITQTLESIRAQTALADCTVVVAADGVRAEQADRRADYDEYLRRLLWQLNYDYTDAVPMLAPTHLHQANLTRLALQHVRTPLILFMEHDTPLVGQTDWSALAAALGDPRRCANLIRLYSTRLPDNVGEEAPILEPPTHLMPQGDQLTMVGDAPLRRTAQWSQRPHLARADFYREVLATYFGEWSRTMIEDVMNGVTENEWDQHGDVGWSKFKIWMYAPEGDLKRSTHLNGRTTDPKFDMIYEYDGDVPAGAPYPTSRREDTS